MLDVQKIRTDFPILATEAHPGVPLVYLDSTASSQKPLAVIEAMDWYYRHDNANVHRGIHRLSEVATAAYEGAREKVRQFVNAAATQEIIYVRNATEAINLVAYTWGRTTLKPGDEILSTEMEHHANIVPWQILAEMTGATLRFLPFTLEGRLDLSQLDEYLTSRTKIFAFTAMSNVFGTINPTKELVAAAHRPKRASPQRRRTRPRLRLPRFFRAQNVWPHRYRCPLRQTTSAPGHAPLHGWWRHDPARAVRRLYLGRFAP